MWAKGPRRSGGKSQGPKRPKPARIRSGADPTVICPLRQAVAGSPTAAAVLAFVEGRGAGGICVDAPAAAIAFPGKSLHKLHRSLAAAREGTSLMASPLEIEIAIWYRTRSPEAGDFGYPDRARMQAPAVQEALKDFVTKGLLLQRVGHVPAEHTSQFLEGPALPAYCEAICSVPFPVQRWVMP